MRKSGRQDTRAGARLDSAAMPLSVSAQPLRARRVALPWSLSAEHAALLVRGDRRPFALVGRWAGGGALIGSEPVRIAAPNADPFAVLDEQPAVQAQERGLVGGGWFGYLGYRLGARLEPVGAGPPPAPAEPGTAAGLPDAALAFYDHLLRLDARGRWWFEALWSPERERELRDRLALLTRRAQTVAPEPEPFDTAAWVGYPTADGHARAVAAARERIHAGDLLQANIAARMRSRLQGDPLDVFAAARTRLPADRSAYLSGPWGALVSLSPELFLSRRGRAVRSAPIKGTRPASPDPGTAAAADRAEARALEASEKDRAENTMIVDLVRNDLGRVCEPGSVQVDVLAEARHHAGVWHLVSEVSGRLREDVGDAELVRAAFPPGSVTGAPKVAAMDVIAELESSPRDVFTGAIGFAGPLAGLELSVAIRTFEVCDGEAWLGVGGGVVADSDPAAEAAECATKAAPLLRAIRARTAAPAAGGHAPAQAGDGGGVQPVGAGRGARPSAAAVVRSAARPTPRPDPRAGVFATVLVRDGEPRALDAHLARLGASVSSLYGARLPPDVEESARAACAGLALARLRILYRPDAGQPLAVVAAPIDKPRPAVHLRSVCLPGGVGAHKWVDRRLLDALGAHAAPAQPLLCDLDGQVLEAGRANVFALCADGVLRTPPLDGRILPGLTRAEVLDCAGGLGLEVREERLGARVLGAAREVFVTGAIGGAEAVHSLDGVPLAREGLAERVAGEHGALV